MTPAAIPDPPPRNDPTRHADRDDALRKLLESADPASSLPTELTALECVILEKIETEPQFDSIPSFGNGFNILAFSRNQLRWPAIAAGTMVLGLVIGYALSAILTPPASTEDLMSLATTEPWQEFVQ